MLSGPSSAHLVVQVLVAFATVAKEAKGLAKATDKVLDEKRRKLLADMVAAASGGGGNGASAAAPAPAPLPAASRRASFVDWPCYKPSLQ